MLHVDYFEKKFRVVVVSLPDRKNCVCEIYYENDEWVEISQENEEIIIQFYSHPSLPYWEFPLDIALKVLQMAKNKYLNLH